MLRDDPSCTVTRKLRPRKKSMSRVENPRDAHLAVDPVKNEIEVIGILLDLRELERAACVLDREWMEVEDVVQQRELIVASGPTRSTHSFVAEDGSSQAGSTRSACLVAPLS